MDLSSITDCLKIFFLNCNIEANVYKEKKERSSSRHQYRKTFGHLIYHLKNLFFPPQVGNFVCQTFNYHLICLTNIHSVDLMNALENHMRSWNYEMILYGIQTDDEKESEEEKEENKRKVKYNCSLVFYRKSYFYANGNLHQISINEKDKMMKKLPFGLNYFISLPITITTLNSTTNQISNSLFYLDWCSLGEYNFTNDWKSMNIVMSNYHHLISSFTNDHKKNAVSLFSSLYYDYEEFKGFIYPFYYYLFEKRIPNENVHLLMFIGLMLNPTNNILKDKLNNDSEQRFNELYEKSEEERYSTVNVSLKMTDSNNSRGKKKFSPNNIYGQYDFSFTYVQQDESNKKFFTTYDHNHHLLAQKLPSSTHSFIHTPIILFKAL